MLVGLVIVGAIMWLAVYGVAVLIAAHQVAKPAAGKRLTAAAFAGNAAPYLIALLFNAVMAVRYQTGAAMLVTGTIVSFALTWIVVGVTRRQLHGKDR
ncbi:MAG TPA: hypothetical protein VI140_09925 [Oxalicibacterium sp.]